MNTQPRRIMLYMHFDRDNLVDEHIFYQLEAYHRFGIKLIFISNSKVPDTDKSRLALLAVEVVERPNRGYDFAAWKQVFLQKGKDFFAGYDEVLIANSSCYGPLFPLEDIFAAMAKKQCDFWGIDEINIGNYFPKMLSAYFVIFRPSAFQTEVFWNYWQTIKEDYDSYRQLCYDGEMCLSATLCKAGLKYETYCDIVREKDMPEIGFIGSICMTAPDWLILKDGSPLLKVKAFHNDPNDALCRTKQIFSAMRNRKSSYPIELIKKHQRRIAPLSWLKNFPDTLHLICGCQMSDMQPVTDCALPVLDLSSSKALDAPVSTVLKIPNQASESQLRVLGVLAIIFCIDDLLLLATRLGELKIKLNCLLFIDDSISEQELFDAQSLLHNNMFSVEYIRFKSAIVSDLFFKVLKNKTIECDLLLFFSLKQFPDKSKVFNMQYKQSLLDGLLKDSDFIQNIASLLKTDTQTGIVLTTRPAVLSLAGLNGKIENEKNIKTNFFKTCNISVPDMNSRPGLSSECFFLRPELLKSFLLQPCFANDSIDSQYSFSSLEILMPYFVQHCGYSYKIVSDPDRLISDFQLYEDGFMSNSHFGLSKQIKITIRLLLKSIIDGYHTFFPGLARKLAWQELKWKQSVKKYTKHE